MPKIILFCIATLAIHFLVPTVGFGGIIVDTATGQRLNTGQFSGDSSFTGHRFVLTETTAIESVGADFRLASPVDTNAFAAIHSLSSLNDRPNNFDLTGTDLLYTSVFNTPRGTDGVLLVPTPGLSLDAGIYSLSFGANAFGAGSNPGLSLIGYATDLSLAQSAFSFRQSDGNFSTTSSNLRFIVNAVPEPSSATLLGFMTLLGIGCRRGRKG